MGLASIATIGAKWKEDVVCTKISTGATTQYVQLTDMQDASNYIIKEIQVYYATDPNADAMFGISTTNSVDGVFGEKYYWVASFILFDGRTNGRLGQTLSTKPYFWANTGTAGPTSDVYVCVRYYYR